MSLCGLEDPSQRLRHWYVIETYVKSWSSNNLMTTPSQGTDNNDGYFMPVKKLCMHDFYQNCEIDA